MIRAWAEDRGAAPASVEGTENDGDADAGILRIDFPNCGNDRLDGVDWDTFFKTFDDRGLSFVYQEKTSDGETSRFNKFVRSEKNG